MPQPKSRNIKMEVFIGTGTRGGSFEKMVHLQIREDETVVSEYAMPLIVAGTLARQLSDCVEDAMMMAAKSLPIKKVDVASGRF